MRRPSDKSVPHELSPKSKNDSHDYRSEHNMGTQGERTGSENFYLDLLKSVLEKNRKRVATYYCPNPRCSVTFFASDLGYQCPDCSSFGVISEYRTISGRKSRSGDETEPVIGYLDSLGRMFCLRCATHLNLDDDVSYIIYESTLPFCQEKCESCRNPLKGS